MIICTYMRMDEQEADNFEPQLVYVNEDNIIITRTSHLIPIQAKEQ